VISYLRFYSQTAIKKVLVTYRTNGKFDPSDNRYVYTYNQLATEPLEPREVQSKKIHDDLDDGNFPRDNRTSLIKNFNEFQAKTTQSGSYISVMHQNPLINGINRKKFFTTVEYDQCPNGCMFFTLGTRGAVKECFCGESRLLPDNSKPQATMKMFSVSDLLAAYLVKPENREKMQYRHRHQFRKGIYDDILDGTKYQKFYKMENNEEDEDTVYLGMYIDGFEPKIAAKGNKLILIHLINFNLDPNER
jgi:hypothetical protein